MISAAQLRVGQQARVVRVLPQEKDRLRMVQMGITEGAPIRIVRRAPLADPLEIEVRGYRMCLRKAQIQNIIVQTEEV